MSNRLNVVFHDEQTDAAYCLLHLRWFDIDEPLLPRILRSLISTIGMRWARPSESMSALAAQIVISLGAQVDADLLPASSPWLADLTVTVRRVDDEFRLSCKKRDLLAITMAPSNPLPDLGPDPVNALDGFDGNAQQLKELVEHIHWREYT